jgi:hypothetical protein
LSGKENSSVTAGETETEGKQTKETQPTTPNKAKQWGKVVTKQLTILKQQNLQKRNLRFVFP